MIDLFIVLGCLAINAFFSAYEMAFVTVSKEEIDELGEKSPTRARVNSFKVRPERTLSVIQIGITLVGAIAAAVGGTGAVESLEPFIVESFGLSRSLSEALSVSIVIVPLTYFSVVFGELVPKTFALKHPLKIISFGTSVLGLIDKLLSPIVSFLELSTNFLLAIMGLTDDQEENESLGQSVEIGNLSEYHQKFVKNLVALKGRKVEGVMIPWSQVSHLSFSDTEEEVRIRASQTYHSRLPVIDGDVVVGILYKKELPALENQAKLPWQSILRPSLKVAESQKVLEAFLKMQEKQAPLAVVENSEGAFTGIITIEDFIEEVVGDIRDKADFSMTSKILSNRTKIHLR